MSSSESLQSLRRSAGTSFVIDKTYCIICSSSTRNFEFLARPISSGPPYERGVDVSSDLPGPGSPVLHEQSGRVAGLWNGCGFIIGMAYVGS